MSSIWDLPHYNLLIAACLLAHKNPDEVDLSALPASVKAQLPRLFEVTKEHWEGDVTFVLVGGPGPATFSPPTPENITITRAKLEALFSPESIWFPDLAGEQPNAQTHAHQERHAARRAFTLAAVVSTIENADPGKYRNRRGKIVAAKLAQIVEDNRLTFEKDGQQLLSLDEMTKLLRKVLNRNFFKSSETGE